MKKLLKGIVDFRSKVLPDYKATFAKLALGQRPDSLFVACSDSRVVPNLFASTDPGDLLVLRNVGNIIPSFTHEEFGHSESACVSFAVDQLGIKDVIVCGHSECGGMVALCGGEHTRSTALGKWLTQANQALNVDKFGIKFDKDLVVHNRVSQANVLLQLEHLRSYPEIQKGILARTIRVHGWWFDIATADVYSYNAESRKFQVIDEKSVPGILKSVE